MYRLAEQDDPQHPPGGVIFREPIVISNIPRLVPGWTKPIIIGRHAFGDQYRATDTRIERQRSSAELPAQRRLQAARARVFDFPEGGGVAMAMYNLDASIRDFARASFRYGLDRGYPVYMSTKNTIIEAGPRPGASRICSRRCSTPSSSPSSSAAHSTYEHRLIDDMFAAALKWEEATCGRARTMTAIQSDTVAQGFGSLGLLTSVLMTADGKAVEAEAAHGTVTRHFREHRKGNPTSTNDRLDLRTDAEGCTPGAGWTNARGRELRQTLERVCVETVESGR